MRAVSNRLIMNLHKAVVGLSEVCIHDRRLHIPGGIRLEGTLEWNFKGQLLLEDTAWTLDARLHKQSVGWISMTGHSPLGLGSFCSVQTVQPYLAALGKLSGRTSPRRGMSYFWHNKLANSLLVATSMNTRGQAFFSMCEWLPLTCKEPWFIQEQDCSLKMEKRRPPRVLEQREWIGLQNSSSQYG